MQAKATHGLFKPGFTLAELLIALSVLGTIATFNISKVVTSTVNSHWNTAAKDVMSMMQNALQLYKAEHGPSLTGVKIADLLPYLNYASVDTTSVVESSIPGNSRDCSLSNMMCIKLHTGGLIWFRPALSFYDSESLSLLPFTFVPHASYRGNSDDFGVEFELYTNGRITSVQNVLPLSYLGSGGSQFFVTPRPDPPWLKWN